jgi:hypothetical protein
VERVLVFARGKNNVSEKYHGVSRAGCLGTVSVHLMPGVGSCPAEHHERSSETRLYSHV